ncbi:chromosome partitioning protein ParB [Liquorilactobacillus mali]|uniref:chromosome partitioning protein ParB n=1 Tax=Liquorilactobacillus mali TaxID=1618 RepID=UPI0029530897|nr:chromosome partitioning protein ParB [Liquorilactobacillus mali]MDV7758621.1 chromosome partitioning protein ParB [Liquorilactobacillus mali]
MNQDLLQQAAAGKLEETGASKKLPIANKNNGNYKVYKIPLDELYYNDLNGRIATQFKQYEAENGAITPMKNSSSYNEVFQDLVYNSDAKALDETKKSIENKSQQEPGVVLKDGRVLDGNRRFTAIRIWQQETNVQKFFEAVILDLDAQSDEKKIKELELELQLGTEAKIGYDPIDRIFDVYNTIEVKKTMTAEEYRDFAGLAKINKVNNDIEFAKLILDFIKIVSPGGNPIDKFYLARDLKLDGPIEEIGKTIADLKSKNKRAVTDAVLVNLVIAKTVNQSKAPNLQIRDVKNSILSDANNVKNYLNAYEKDDRIDDVVDYFKVNPIKSSNDLKIATESTDLKPILTTLNKSTERLVEKSKKATKRTKILTNLDKIRDNLEDIHTSNFKSLTPDEFIESKEMIVEIKKTVNKLLYELGKSGE